MGGSDDDASANKPGGLVKPPERPGGVVCQERRQLVVPASSWANFALTSRRSPG